MGSDAKNLPTTSLGQDVNRAIHKTGKLMIVSKVEHENMIAPFYRAIGRALSRWQHVEAGLFLVAHAIFGTEFRYSSTVFFMINSADLKLRLVEKLCKLHFPEKFLASNWRPLAKEIESAIRFRNGLAHFEANYVTDPSYLGPDEPPVVLSAHHLDFSRRDNNRAASTNNINEAADEFLLLSNRLIEFVANYFRRSA